VLFESMAAEVALVNENKCTPVVKITSRASGNITSRECMVR